jgi:hypothetical protein
MKVILIGEKVKQKNSKLKSNPKYANVINSIDM